MTSLPFTYGPLFLVVILTGVAAGWDLRTGLIPNRLVALGAVATVVLVIGTALPLGSRALAAACISIAAGILLVSLVPLLLYRLGGIGGGDVKLLAVVGTALGPARGIEAELYAFAAVLVYAPAKLLWEGKLLQTLRTSARLLVRPLMPRQRRLPPMAAEELTAFRFGPAIFAGTLAVALLHWVER
jgi:prepilin peptidase CpaA